MKATIAHLPPHKQEELQALTEIIRKSCPDAVMIILYGSYARGDWREEKDIPVDATSGSASDFDILVVTEHPETLKENKIWQAIEKAFFKLKPSAYLQMIYHSIDYLNQKLRQGRFFFADIQKEGCLLYDSKKFKLAERKKLSPVERQELAKLDFDYWFDRAEGFFSHFEFDMKKEKYSLSAFSLHQATEACYKAVLLVYTGYTPKEHYLKKLGPKAERRAARLKNIFPKKTTVDQERFKKLDYAYVGARYDRLFIISKEELEILSTSTKELLQKTQEVCQKKIESFVEGEV